MYYELYIDVFFLENFMMDALLLMLTGRMIRCQAGKGRIFFGAALGAFLTCVAVLIPVPYLLIRLILFYGGINLLMLKVCFQTGWDRTLLFAWIFPLCQWFPAGRSPGNGPAVYGKPGAVFLSGVFLLSDLVEDLGPSGSPSADGRIPVPGDPPGKGKKAGNRGSHR